jgi:hypothetical protein
MSTLGPQGQLRRRHRRIGERTRQPPQAAQEIPRAPSRESFHSLGRTCSSGIGPRQKNAGRSSRRRRSRPAPEGSRPRHQRPSQCAAGIRCSDTAAPAKVHRCTAPGAGHRNSAQGAMRHSFIRSLHDTHDCHRTTVGASPSVASVGQKSDTMNVPTSHGTVRGRSGTNLAASDLALPSGSVGLTRTL